MKTPEEKIDEILQRYKQLLCYTNGKGQLHGINSIDFEELNKDLQEYAREAWENGRRLQDLMRIGETERTKNEIKELIQFENQLFDENT